MKDASSIMKRAVKGLEVKAIFHDAKEQNCLHCWQTFSLWPLLMGKKKKKKIEVGT